ncbi:MAG: hypothetical protein PHW00_03165 [Clostridia bacterium]|nr:hypothetical protein [Clostridia bacterium]
MAISAKDIVDRISNYNKENRINPLDSNYIEEKIQQRKTSYAFSTDNYVEAMIYSMLSSATVWQKIADNKPKIVDIFGNFSSSYIKSQKPEDLYNELGKIKCCGQSTNKQICALKDNIAVFERIEEKNHGSIDEYVSSVINSSPDITEAKITLIKSFAKKGDYKLKEMGIALVCEFLRNVGIDTIKPDRHICRIVDAKHLNLLSADLSIRISKKKVLSDTDKIEILRELEKFSQDSDVKPYILDSLLWDYCASGKDNAGVCLKQHPKCEICVFKDVCQKQSGTT